MEIRIEGAGENNLKDADVVIGDGLTAVTGVSGSGKSSLVFDTLHRESRRCFLEAFGTASAGEQLPPARVKSLSGVCPSAALGQNLLNRNPNSTVATASGLHPYLRVLFSAFGQRSCPVCGEILSVLSVPEIETELKRTARSETCSLRAPLVRGAPGSHRTLLKCLSEEFPRRKILTDGVPWNGGPLPPGKNHDIDISLGEIGPATGPDEVEAKVREAFSLGASFIKAVTPQGEIRFSREASCTFCGTYLGPLEPKLFHTPCRKCGGEGCPQCAGTGLHPSAAGVRVLEKTFPRLLSLTASDASELFSEDRFPGAAHPLLTEIRRRLKALLDCGLGYAGLNRSVPTLSRGEAQRLRLSTALLSPLEDMLHILDEPTIGQHPKDIGRFLPVLRDLGGPVLYVEHDAAAVSAADRVIEMGPGAGERGGRVIFNGTPRELWESDTPSGRFFSGRDKPKGLELKPPDTFFRITGGNARNLQDITLDIAEGRFNVICGVSGSGKSTLIEEVLVPTVKEGKPVNCQEYDGTKRKILYADQTPIGRNPRSNPATYTKLADIIRDIFAERTGLPASCFSFNRPDGSCEVCGGMGAMEVKMKFLPSVWVKCEECGGRRFSKEILDFSVALGGGQFDIASFLSLSVEEARRVLQSDEGLTSRNRRKAEKIFSALLGVGLGYIRLDQPSPTLSGGEAQRIKLAKHLGASSLKGTVLVLDEPSTGLHPSDTAKLIGFLKEMRDAGSTVVCIEHNTDFIRTADHLIELGPGAGLEGGRLLFQGPPGKLAELGGTPTADVLNRTVQRWSGQNQSGGKTADAIKITGASANNLKGIDLEFRKGLIHAVTGVSGSGKSSLVRDVLEAEARKRYLETLSVYERQNVSGGRDGQADSVTGLGLALSVGSDRFTFSRRATIGSVTRLSRSAAVLLSRCGTVMCVSCGSGMDRTGESALCGKCGKAATVPEPGYFLPSTYGAACLTCHGVGTLQEPEPEKLIIHPEKTLCGGAMYSPGFFPKGYLCKPGNGGYDTLQALSARYGFDPMETPWNRMSESARHAFLFGDPEPMEVQFRSKSGRSYRRKAAFPGFYGWIGDWDTGGTYTERVVCPECGGAKLRPEYLAVRLDGADARTLDIMPITELKQLLSGISVPEGPPYHADYELKSVLRRLEFLDIAGLGYASLSREASTLSAGETQRIRLAGLLGSGLTGITVLLDEPSRGLHPRETKGLVNCLRGLKDRGNTVIVIEHDPDIIKAVDMCWEFGPGSGSSGGRIIASGPPETVTGRGLTGPEESGTRVYRRPDIWMRIRGARGNNLKIDEQNQPLGRYSGSLGVSGSGKGALRFDTIEKVLNPLTHTTSVPREPLDPEPYNELLGAPADTLVVDQSSLGNTSPAAYLGVDRIIKKHFRDAAEEAGLNPDDVLNPCGVCGGSGTVRTDLGFLPSVREICDVCGGSGFPPETSSIRIKGISLSRCMSMTLDDLASFFGHDRKLRIMLDSAATCGIGYLTARQPGRTLSGGERQRLRIASVLSKRKNRETLFILDEPTVGLHRENARELAAVLDGLAENGNSVIVIEHSMEFLARCDWLIELGPEGGPDGGRIIFQGTPRELAAAETPSSFFMREVLG